jgi:leucyl aminopeptidase
MNFSISPRAIELRKGHCLLIGVVQNESLQSNVITLPQKVKSAINAAAFGANFKGEVGKSVALHVVPEIQGCSIVLFGLGGRSELSKKTFITATNHAIDCARNLNISRAYLAIPDLKIPDIPKPWQARKLSLAASLKSYQFHISQKEKFGSSRAGDRKIVFSMVGNTDTLETKNLVIGNAIGDGCNLARNLGNLPPNICTPAYLANVATEMGRTFNFQTRVLDERQMEKLGMNALLAVSKGSAQPAKFIEMIYRGAPKNRSPIVIIGKGVTFDTGGISIKPSSSMDEMKYDMSGAGSVLGTLLTISKLKLPINVVGLIPAVENMPGGKATRPGDIVKTKSGLNVEILNTDAEGRLILCDAITYAEKFNPSVVIDIATLTGACVVALGKVATGLFSNDDKLSAELVEAGEKSWDRVWQMPIWDDYQQQLKSNFADLANIGGREAGSVTAACFLSKFATKFPWAHLDIAGTAWNSGSAKGSTGRPVPLLSEFILRRCGL